MNAIGTLSVVAGDPINSGLTQRRLKGCVEAVAKMGGISSVGTRFSLNMENEQDDAGRDGRTCLTRPNSQARTGAGFFFFPNMPRMENKVVPEGNGPVPQEEELGSGGPTLANLYRLFEEIFHR